MVFRTWQVLETCAACVAVRLVFMHDQRHPIYAAESSRGLAEIARVKQELYLFGTD
jgi:hypothetical protein